MLILITLYSKLGYDTCHDKEEKLGMIKDNI